MACIQKKYHEVRSKMQPGDIIAFSGKGNFSEIIKWTTRSEVSHIGIVFESKVLFNDAPQPGRIVDVFESTTLHEDPQTGQSIAGVQRNRMSEHVEFYDGKIWWLPLREDVRENLDLKKFTDFLMHQDNKPYDMPQAVKSALDLTDHAPIVGGITRNKEDFASFFCSELAATALEAGRAIRKINASEVTPIDLCQFDIFERNYYQLKGRKTAINRYNSVDPNGFGER